MKTAQRTRAPNDIGKQYRARTNIVNTNAWSRIRGRVETIMPRSDEHAVGRTSSEEGPPRTSPAQAESCTILSAKKPPTLSRSLLMTSASLLSAGFKSAGDFDQGSRMENASWDRTAPSQEARPGGKEPKMHHDSSSQRAVSRNLTLLNDTFRTLSFNESLSNRVLANTDKTPGEIFAGTS